MNKMKYRKAVFIIVYSRIKNQIYYLILKRKRHWKGWEFPKGGIEKREKISDAIKREVKEETGLNALKIKKFNISGRYKYDKDYPNRKGFGGQSFSLYDVEVEKKKVKVDGYEHSDYKWVDFKEAIKKLKWPNQKKCLNVVNNYLLK